MTTYGTEPASGHLLVVNDNGNVRRP